MKKYVKKWARYPVIHFNGRTLSKLIHPLSIGTIEDGEDARDWLLKRPQSLPFCMGIHQTRQKQVQALNSHALAEISNSKRLLQGSSLRGIWWESCQLAFEACSAKACSRLENVCQARQKQTEKHGIMMVYLEPNTAFDKSVASSGRSLQDHKEEDKTKVRLKLGQKRTTPLRWWSFFHLWSKLSNMFFSMLTERNRQNEFFCEFMMFNVTHATQCVLRAWDG